MILCHILLMAEGLGKYIVTCICACVNTHACTPHTPMLGWLVGFKASSTFVGLSNAKVILFSSNIVSFANGPGDWGSVPGRVIPKTKKKMALDAALLNTQQYKVRIKGKVEE